MKNNKSNFDFPNPLEHIKLGFKTIKLEEIANRIKSGDIIAVFTEKTADFYNFAKKLSRKKDCIILEKLYLPMCLLKKYAVRQNKFVIIKKTAKRAEQKVKGKLFKRYVRLSVRLACNPYYYIIGGKCKNKKIDVGWTVSGINILSDNL